VLDNVLIIKKLKDSMLLGLMKLTLYMPLLITLNGKVLYINILNITITLLTVMLTSVSLNSPSQEKLKLITSSFPTKSGPGSKPTENNTLTQL